MERIGLQQVLPEVFAGKSMPASQVWMQHVELERGRKYLLEAASGSGKSSLCSFLYGRRHDYRGTVAFDGIDIRHLTTDDWVELRKRSLAMMFQEFCLFPELTAMENVEVKNRLTGFRKKKELVGWFERLGIADQMGIRVGQMSLGQQQRVAFMRALCQPFDFIMLDEPVSHLDDRNAQVLGEMLLEEAGKQQAAVVVTSVGRRLMLDYDEELTL